MKVQDMEGYQDVVGKFLDSLSIEEVVSHYSTEQLLAALPPEQRLAGLDRDHQPLAFPLEVLRLLPEDYLRSLAPAVELEIRRRLCPGRP